MGLFIRKPLSHLLAEAGEGGRGSLKRVLGPWGLIAFGIGVIVGAGLFSITGLVAAEYAGPAITLSFAIAAVGCCFAGLCYAEFASMIPIAGSAYTYSYATMGELVAWIIGWDLVLEYAVAATLVSISWSSYVTHFLAGVGIVLPEAFTAGPWNGGICNLPAAGVVVLMSLFLVCGTAGSARLNNVIVFLKLSIIFVFIFLGWRYINAENYHPYVPENTTGVFGEFGWSGVLRGAAVVFFAYLGFDSVSTAAQETRDPKRNMPIGILGSLVVCTLLYVLFAHVMTGVANYRDFSGQEGIAPVATAISRMGTVVADGTVVPAFPWLNRLVVIAIIFGYCSVILVQLMAQSRIFMSMGSDGLLPGFFARVHPRFRTPVGNNLVFMLLISTMAAVVPPDVAGEMVSIGTLFAFVLVCAGVVIVRRTMPEVPRGFKVPLVPLVPVLGILVCLSLMLFLPADTWLRLVIWMLLGLDIYGLYGMRRSKMAAADTEVLPDGTFHRRGTSVYHLICLVLGFLCLVTGFWHQDTVGWNADTTLFGVACVFGLAHIAYYSVRMLFYSRRKDRLTR